MESRLLDLHGGKISYLIAAASKARKRMKKKIEICDKNMKEVSSNKYVGCKLSFSVGETVSHTIASRIVLANR